MLDSSLSNPSPTKTDKNDKDKKIKLMNDLLKTNQKHIEHLKQMVDQLKKQLTFEQKQKEDFQRENVTLKKQVQFFKEKLKQNNLDEGEKLQNISSSSLPKKNENESSLPQSSNNLDNIQIKPLEQIIQVFPDDLQKQSIKLISPDSALKIEKQGSNLSEKKYIQRDPSPLLNSIKNLKINVSSALLSQSLLGPLTLTSVKKSMTYMHELKDERLAQAMKRSLIILPEGDKTVGKLSSGLNSSLIKSSGSLNNQFSFNSTVYENVRNSLTPIPVINEEKSPVETKLKRISSFQNQPESIIKSKLNNVQLEISKIPNIFEDFYILGCQKKDFIEFDSDSNLKEGIIPAQILYKFSSKQINLIEQNSYEYIIHEFAYPFGIKAEKLRSNDAFLKLKEIMYSGNKYELLDKFHIFTLKNSQENQNKSPYLSEVLKKCNPEYRLFGICLSVYDYIESTDENVELTQQNRKKRIFWKFKKTYCFLTYFPFFEFFQDILIQLINIIKMSRIERFLQKASQEQEVLQEIDGEKIVSSLEKETTDLLEMVRKLPEPVFNGSILLETLTGSVKYKIADSINISIDTRLWSASITSQLLTYRQVLTIFLSMMNEISVVIVCQKSSVLTALMFVYLTKYFRHFFHNLIQPIKWIHPVIYSLPESLLTLIESPVPIFVGLNVSEAYIQELELVERTDNLLFVFIDHEVKLLAKPITLLQNVASPHFDGLLGKLEGTMNNPTKVRNPSPGLQNKRSVEQKQVRFIQDEKDKQNSTLIMQTFNKCIIDFIINKIPLQVERQKVINLHYFKDGFINTDIVEKKVLNNSKQKDKEFIKAIFRTQYFNFFLDEYYK